MQRKARAAGTLSASWLLVGQRRGGMLRLTRTKIWKAEMRGVTLIENVLSNKQKSNVIVITKKNNTSSINGALKQTSWRTRVIKHNAPNSSLGDFRTLQTLFVIMPQQKFASIAFYANEWTDTITLKSWRVICRSSADYLDEEQLPVSLFLTHLAFGALQTRCYQHFLYAFKHFWQRQIPRS